MTQFSYRLGIEYLGTQYSGWQIQNQGQKTVQGEILAAAKKMAKSDDVHLLGASRTDSGVHALGQVARLDFPLPLPEEAILKGLNAYLDRDIRIHSVSSCEASFHPILHKSSKLYHYYFSIGEHYKATQRLLMAHCPYSLNVEAMQRGCALFLGEHDFVNFQCQGSDVPSTIRKILSCELRSTHDSFPGLPAGYVLEVRGEGFLKQMIRLMVGALWELGRGKISLEDLETSLQKPMAKRLGPVAPAEGLFLIETTYS